MAEQVKRTPEEAAQANAENAGARNIGGVSTDANLETMQREGRAMHGEKTMQRQAAEQEAAAAAAPTTPDERQTGAGETGTHRDAKAAPATSTPKKSSKK